MLDREVERVELHPKPYLSSHCLLMDLMAVELMCGVRPPLEIRSQYKRSEASTSNYIVLALFRA